VVVAERERLSAARTAMPIDVFPSGANFILFRPRTLTGRDVWQGLLDRSVLIRDCSGWPRLEGCLRVTIGTPAENDEFLTALSEVLA
jgi:histidinol-phosphate aminotransferase